MEKDALGSPRTIRVSRAAELLLWTRSKQSQLDGLPPDLCPRDLTEAYDIQLAVSLLRPMPHAGFKIGLTSQEAQRSVDTAAPIAGRLSFADVRRSESIIELPRRHLRVVEAEVIFEVGQDLPAAHAPYSEQRVAASLRQAFAGIELCDSRFADHVPFSLTSLVADNSNADLLIVGDPLPEQDLAALDNLPVTLQCRGQAVVRGSTHNVLGNPLRSVTWLANWLARRGEGLRRGQWVSSGSCTGMTEVAADDVVVATFGTAARAMVEFTPPHE